MNAGPVATLPDRTTARRIRVYAGLTQRMLASQLGVDRVSLCRWETGERRPRGTNRQRYAELLKALAEAQSA